MNKFISILKKEILELIPPTLFFFFVFHIMMLVEGLLAKEFGYSFSASTTALIGAILVGKSILIVDALPMLKFKPNQKLITPMIWRIFSYLIIVILFQIIEAMIPILSKTGSFSVAMDDFIMKINWDHFWAVHLVLFLFLIIYTIINAIIDTIGITKFRAIFFSTDRTI
jgi:hypothetical protein